MSVSLPTFKVRDFSSALAMSSSESVEMCLYPSGSAPPRPPPPPLPQGLGGFNGVKKKGGCVRKGGVGRREDVIGRM